MPVPSNPFAEFTKTLNEMKWPSFNMPEMKWPAVDVNAFADMQKRNFEAMAKANHVAMDGFRALVERQAEIAQASAADAQATMKSLMETGKGPDFEAQLNAARTSIEKATADLRELQDIVAKSQSEVFDIVNERMLAAMDEMRQPANGGAKKKA